MTGARDEIFQGGSILGKLKHCRIAIGEVVFKKIRIELLHCVLARGYRSVEFMSMLGDEALPQRDAIEIIPVNRDQFRGGVRLYRYASLPLAVFKFNSVFVFRS